MENNSPGFWIALQQFGELFEAVSKVLRNANDPDAARKKIWDTINDIPQKNNK